MPQELLSFPATGSLLYTSLVGDQSQFDFSFAPPPRRVWPVRELVTNVRTTLEREFTDVWVEGEISNYRPAESGHLYFSLKDGDAQLRIVIFRAQARLLRFKPDNGLRVLVRGRVTIYEGRGELQLMGEYMEPMGAGALQVAFEQLKAKLAAEGLFERSRKKPLPALPRHIGIVTSPRGAAIQDILNILRRRHEGVNITIFPAQVQGESAAGEVSAGVRHFSRTRSAEVIIVARGGGSVEDLAAFNDEGLARTIAASTIPVISAVGHETDFTICDFVADLRAPTPSAAAELVIRSHRELQDHVAGLRTRLARASQFRLLRARQSLTSLAQHGAFARVRQLIARREQRLDEFVNRLAHAEYEALRGYHRRLDVASARVRHHDLRTKLAGMRREVDARVAALSATARNQMLRNRARLDQLVTHLEALSPLAILDRGYALVFDAQGQLVKDASRVSPGERITARVARGTLAAEVKESSGL